MERETSPDTWRAVDELIETMLPPEPAAARLAAERCRLHDLPAISVTPAGGRFLAFLARIIGARRVLEIGTLGGYSTAWFQHAIGAEGRIATIEIDPAHARIARETFEHAGIAPCIDVRLGAAPDVLPTLVPAHERSFDLAFIDADKPNNPGYISWALRLVRPGGLIIVDNVVRHGAILDALSSDASVRGARQAIEDLGRVRSGLPVVLQTVGGKGYDGMAVAIAP